MTNNELLQQGIDLAKRGSIEQASILFAQVVKVDPKSELGWLWLGRCRIVLREKRDCFNKVLSINPNNEDAQRELTALDSLEVYPSSSSPSTKLPILVPAAFTEQSASINAPQTNTPATDTIVAPTKKPWVRRTIYVLAGIMVGIYLGRYIGNSLAAIGFFDKIDAVIALRTINVPEFNASPEIPEPIEPTPTISLADSYDKRLEQAWPLIIQANGLAGAQKYGDAVPIWNQALEIVPEYIDGYYKRGAAYFYLTQSQRAKSEYDFYLELAIKDFDKAIDLDPDVADYYIMRGRAYSSLAYQQSSRVDFQRLEQVAIENYLYSEKLPHQEVWNNMESNLYRTMVESGDCEKVIQKVNELINSQTDPAPGLHSVLSDAYYCTGNLEKALEEKDEAIKLAPSSVCLCEQAMIFYGLGRFDEAMDAIEKSLSHQPYYGGDRYYFRALIYVDRDKTEQAQKDLDFGMTQTWSRGGMLSYVQGKIALAQNRKEEALFYFQDAEATYLDEGPMLEQIREDLIALGGVPRDTKKTSFEVTPIPLPQ
jgi:tetratricopeptide (TPR) repeat protein